MLESTETYMEMDSVEDYEDSVDYSMLIEQLNDPIVSYKDYLSPLLKTITDDTDKEVILDRVYDQLHEKFGVSIDRENVEDYEEAVYLLYKLCVVNIVSTLHLYLYYETKGMYLYDKNFSSNYPAPTYSQSNRTYRYEDYSLINNIKTICNDVAKSDCTFSHLLDVLLEVSSGEEEGIVKFIKKLIDLEDRGMISAPNLIEEIYDIVKVDAVMESIIFKTLKSFWDEGLIKGDPIPEISSNEEEEGESYE